MSVKLMGAVWELELPQAEKFVLLALADHAHDDGRKCFPGVAYLAWKTGYSRRQVQRTLRALEKKAVIEPVAHDKGGRGVATEYVIHVGKGVKLSPFVKTERVTSETEKGDIQDQKGDIHVTPTIRTVSNRQEPSSTRVAQALPSPFVFQGQHLQITGHQDKLLRDAYPWVDTIAEYRKIECWLEAHPERRTAKPNHFKRAQNWIGRIPSPSSGKGGPNRAEARTHRNLEALELLPGQRFSDS